MLPFSFSGIVSYHWTTAVGSVHEWCRWCLALLRAAGVSRQAGTQGMQYDLMYPPNIFFGLSLPNCMYLVSFPDPLPKRKGGSDEYSTSSHYGLAVAMVKATEMSCWE